MSYNDELNKISRKLIQLVILKLDYCSLTFGISPCLATGVKCYNTFATCKYKQAYTKITKEYRYTNINANINNAAELNAKPYLENIEFIPTEVRDDKTIPARCNIKLRDEYDTDIGIDKYVTERVDNILEVGGTHFKKLIERNPNYRGRTVEIYEGFDGLNFSEFQLKGVFKISNIKRNGYDVNIECVDFIKAIDEIKYPIRLSAKIKTNIPACYKCQTEEDMLKLNAKNGEYALRTDFDHLVCNVSYGSNGYLNTGEYIYTIVGYDQFNNPVAKSNDYILNVDNNEDITFDWQFMGIYFPWVSKYRIFRKYEGGNYYYIETTSLSFYDNGTTNFVNIGNPEDEAYRLFQLNGENPAILNNWQIIVNSLNIDITDTSNLFSSGFIKIEDEIISYTSKDSEKIYNIKRLQFNTKADTTHYAGTNIYSILYYNPGNPFSHLLSMLSIAGFDSSRIEETKLNSYKNSYSGIKFSLKPIIKETDLSKIIMDLVNILDGKLWVNEQGKIDFKYNTEITPNYTITDESNIIIKSPNIEYKQEDICTRIICYYDIYDITKGINDKENYQKVNITIDVDAESDNDYGEAFTKEIKTIWINSDCGTQSEIDNYLNNLMKNKLKRMRVPRPYISFDVELKDALIKTGDVISISTDEFNNIDGTNYNGKLFEVIKKDPKNNKITITARYIPTPTITTVNDNGIRILDQPKAVTKFYLPEVKVTGLKYIDAEGISYNGSNHDLEAENIIKLQWDNMYMSSQTQATDINGLTRQLPKVWVYAGYPPAPHHQVYDLSSWKSVNKYKIYMFVAKRGFKYSSIGRPSINDSNGKWYLVATVNDKKITDANYKYTLEYPIPITLAGRYIAFDVYVEAKIEYDPNSPIGIQIPLQGVAF